MDIWATHSKRVRTCINCTHQIHPGDRVIMGQTKRTFHFGTRTRRMISHFKCWVSNAETYLDDNPYEPRRVAGPGRPKTFTTEQRKHRLVLQVQMRRWTLKQEEYINMGMWTVAEGYKEKVAGARLKLNEMLC